MHDSRKAQCQPRNMWAPVPGGRAIHERVGRRAIRRFDGNNFRMDPKRCRADCRRACCACCGARYARLLDLALIACFIIPALPLVLYLFFLVRIFSSLLWASVRAPSDFTSPIFVFLFCCC